MSIQHIHTYLVHPKKGSTEPSQTSGALVRLDEESKLFQLLETIYAKSDQECRIDITFVPTPEGKQQNDCRDLICRYVEKPRLATGKAIAERLEMQTDGRSGLGLLFLILGKEGRDHKLVISRFPTDNAIYVDENPSTLTVQFLERVFMKNKASYKAVVYRSAALRAGFWSGRAIDKQLGPATGKQSDYWIIDFLLSRLSITAAQGTRRLASALRKAAERAGPGVKQEIVSAATLASGLVGQRLSISNFGQRFGLSSAARDAIDHELKRPHLADEIFEFDLTEFQSVIAFKSAELDNGATVTAPASRFEEVIHSEIIDAERQLVRFSTEGRIVNEKLRATA